jgi:hypothetical protein
MLNDRTWLTPWTLPALVPSGRNCCIVLPRRRQNPLPPPQEAPLKSLMSPTLLSQPSFASGDRSSAVEDPQL